MCHPLSIHADSWNVTQLLNFHSSVPAKDPSREGSRVLSIPDDHPPVDDHVTDARGVLVGLRVGRPVIHALRIEADQISLGAYPNNAAIVEAKLPSRKSGHLSDRLFQGKDTLFPDILPKDSGERPVISRVNLFRPQIPIRGQG